MDMNYVSVYVTTTAILTWFSAEASSGPFHFILKGTLSINGSNSEVPIACTNTNIRNDSRNMVCFSPATMYCTDVERER